MTTPLEPKWYEGCPDLDESVADVYIENYRRMKAYAYALKAEAERLERACKEATEGWDRASRAVVELEAQLADADRWAADHSEWVSPEAYNAALAKLEEAQKDIGDAALVGHMLGADQFKAERDAALARVARLEEALELVNEHMPRGSSDNCGCEMCQLYDAIMPTVEKALGKEDGR